MKILDIYKNPLYTLYQWDVNQFINVVGINPEMPVSVQYYLPHELIGHYFDFVKNKEA